MSATNAALELTRDANGLLHSGDIPITVVSSASPLFVWPNAIAFALMVDSSLGGNGRILWEIHSTIGFSSSVAFGHVPLFAQEIAGPLSAIAGSHYFVSIYGTYPHFGIQEFVA